MSDAQVVLLDQPAAGVARLLINRPDKRNAIDFDVREALLQHLGQLMADGGQTRALVIGGVGGNFSAGGDLASMSGLDADGVRQRFQHIHALCRLLASAPFPVVSAMEGVAAGAAIGMALLGDHIVVGEGTKILFPFLKIGLTPDWGQLLTLPRKIGLPQARRVLAGAAAVTGPEALHIGLADQMVADREVMSAAVQWASAMAMLPADAFARMKSRLANPSMSLAEELAREESDQVVCLQGDEFAEGFAALKDKRSPNFIDLPGAGKS